MNQIFTLKKLFGGRDRQAIKEQFLYSLNSPYESCGDQCYLFINLSSLIYDGLRNINKHSLVRVRGALISWGKYGKK